MRYFITGISGQLGYDVNRELISQGVKSEDILAPDAGVLDITDKEKVEKMLLEFKPDVIIHCAAYTAVDKAEIDSDKCYNINVVGTKNICDVASKISAKMVYISTDYVFDGTKPMNELYEVTDVVNPLSVYGKTKYLGEVEVQKVPKHFIVRTSWVFGINGGNFVKTMLKLSESHDKLTVVNDQVGSPTYTVDLAHLIVTLVNTEKYGTYHVNNEGFCSWAEFAKYILKDNEVEVIPVTTAEYYKNSTKVVAKRPFNSRLSKKALDENGFERLPDWKDATDRYKNELIRARRK